MRYTGEQRKKKTQIIEKTRNKTQWWDTFAFERIAF